MEDAETKLITSLKSAAALPCKILLFNSEPLQQLFDIKVAKNCNLQ